MKKALIALFAVLLFAPFGLVLAALESTPRVPDKPPATPEDARRAQEVLGAFWSLTQRSYGERNLVVSERDLNGTLNFATRAVPMARGLAEVEARQVRVTGALELPYAGWLNVTAELAESEDGLEVAAFRVGALPVPPGLVLPTLSLGLDLLLGEGLGAIAVSGIDSLAIAGDRVVLGVAMNGRERRALLHSAKDKVRRAAGMIPSMEVRRYWLALDQAAASAPAGRYSSFADYLSEAVALAADAAVYGSPEREPRREMQASLIALAVYCGHMKFQNVVGSVVPSTRLWQRTHCERTGLAGRGDLRQHFAISMGLKIASDAGMAFAIGEFKELLDANAGGSGFSFDDIAADRAGIAFAELILETAPEGWRALAGRLASEEAIFPSIAGLPSQMSEAEFARRFGHVESAAYKAMLREIDARIAALPALRAL